VKETTNRSRPEQRRVAILTCLLTLALTLPACNLVQVLSGIPDPGGVWSGTITISRTGESTETTGAGTCCTDITRRVLNDVVTVQVVNNQATGRVSYNYAEYLTARQANEPGTFDITQDTVTAGSGVESKNSRVTVTLAKDGSYEIEVDVPSVEGTRTRDGRSILTCKYPPPTCSPSDSRTHDSAPAPGLSGAGEVVEGKVTPGSQAVLSGTKTEQFLFSGILKGTLTITWNLVRK
jgi:hypothetical protein